MDRTTRSQEMAQRAFSCVQVRASGNDKDRKEYRSFAREFPTLVHQCGLAQAVAFALAKKGQQEQFVLDLAKVLAMEGGARKLDEEARKAVLAQYLRLSRHALIGAVWLKRYVEALFADPSKPEDRK